MKTARAAARQAKAAEDTASDVREAMAKLTSLEKAVSELKAKVDLLLDAVGPKQPAKPTAKK